MSTWTVPGYTEVREVGRGASGRVVEARSESSGRSVAIKYLSDKLQRDPDFLAGFRHEAQLLSELDVPQVVRLIDYVEEPGKGAAIVMELVDGVSLHELISRRGPTGAEAALAVLKGSLLGLAAAHALGVVHRDYKPENVLVDRSAQSKLSDFGIAVQSGRTVPSAGTPAYMAPEQWTGGPPTPATDIYAATAVFFECLTGRPPFAGRIRQLRQQHEHAPVPASAVDEPLRGLVERGLAKDPAARPADAGAFVAELQQTAVAGYGADWEERGRSQLKERAAALLLLLGSAGVSGAGAGVAVTRFLRGHKAATAAVTALVVVAGTTVGTALASQSSPHVAAAAAVTPPAAAQSCTTPATFAFSATLTAAQPGSVSYRWLYSGGTHGPIQTISFAKAGSQQLSGGVAQADSTGTGWAQVQVISPAGLVSNRAIYRLMCTSGLGATADSVSAVASVAPSTQSVTCGTAPPRFTFAGTITTSRPTTVTYYWAMSDGTTTVPATLSFPTARTLAVQPHVFTPPGDTDTGSAVIVVTSPVATASNSARFVLACSPATSGPGGGGQTPLPVHSTASAPDISIALSSNPASPVSVTCGSSWPSFTVTGVISSSQATQVSYEWVRGDGSVAGPATVAIAAGGTADVTDSVDPSSSTYSSTDTLRVTSPVAASASIPLSVSCVPSHVTGVSVSVGSVDEDAYTDCAEPVTALVTIAVTTSNTGPVTLTWALSESQSESPGSTTATGSQAFSGHTSYSLIFTGTFSQTCPALIMPYFLAATATATGGDGQAVTAQGYSEVYPVT